MKTWLVEASLGGKWFEYEAETAAIEGGALVLYNGDIFEGREIVAIFGPQGWTFVRPKRDDEDVEF